MSNQTVKSDYSIKSYTEICKAVDALSAAVADDEIGQLALVYMTDFLRLSRLEITSLNTKNVNENALETLTAVSLEYSTGALRRLMQTREVKEQDERFKLVRKAVKAHYETTTAGSFWAAAAGILELDEAERHKLLNYGADGARRFSSMLAHRDTSGLLRTIFGL